jgi:hypothetical protein
MKCMDIDEYLLIAWYKDCYNPSLGLATKARACKNAGQEGSLGVTFHAPESAKGVRE